MYLGIYLNILADLRSTNFIQPGINVQMVNMAALSSGRINDEIEQISLYNVRPLLLHGYIAPFLVLYSVWLYMWTIVYGVNDYFEAGLIVLAIVGLLQILSGLFCLWFVEVRCLLTCSKVRFEKQTVLFSYYVNIF